MEPWLSVLMPTYNGAAYIGAALESVASQGTADLEVVVVDDGSTDATLDIAQSFAPRLPLKIVQAQRTGNWVAGTNLAIGLASGRYLSCLHQDDLWLPGRYQQLRAAVERLGEPDLIVHPAQFIGATGKVLGEWRCPLPTNGGLVAPEVMLSRLLVQNFLAMPAPMFRRAAIERVGGFDETLWYTADWDLWLKLATIGPTLYLPTPLACFRLHQESQTASRSADAAEFRRQLETVLARHLPPHSATANNAGRRLAGVAQFSIDVNTFLAALSHGQRQSLSRLAWRGFRLGPLGWLEYWRDSRIGERVASRLRLRRGPVA